MIDQGIRRSPAMLGGFLVLAVVMGLLLAAPATAQSGGSAISLRPQIEGNRAVQGGQRVLAEGAVPPGTIESAQLVAIESDGTEKVQEVPEFALNRGPDGTRDYLQNDGGELTGQLILTCLFARPSEGCPLQTTGAELAVLDVQIGGATYRSSAIRVDYERPQIIAYEVIGTNRIRVRWDEPVKPHQDGENVLDWRVTEPDRVVTGVEPATEDDCITPERDDSFPGLSTGCTRTLVLLQPVGEDVRPVVAYELSRISTDPARPTNRTSHEDFASNNTFRESTTFRADDLIRPALPVIQSVAGRAPSGSEPLVRGNDRGPVVRVGNLVAGHSVQLHITRPGGAELVSPPEPFQVPSDGAHDIELPALAGSSEDDGLYRLEAVVTDPHGNRSDESHKGAARDDGSPSAVGYDLDTVAPRFEDAFQSGARSVTVILDEDVFPDGQAGRWLVDGREVSAEGSGDTRTLRTSTDVTSASQVAWEAAGSTYRDAHGNALVPFQGSPIDLLPELSPPIVEHPTGEVHVPSADDDRARVRGTADAGLLVELFDVDADEPRASTTAGSDGRWTIDPGLAEDGRHRFVVRTRRSDSDVRSASRPVPDIVLDTRQPDLTVHEPSLRPLADLPIGTPVTDQRRQYAVGDPVTVEWTAADPAPGGEDNGRDLDIGFLVGGQRRVVSEGRPFVADSRSSFSYTLTQADHQAQDSAGGQFDVVARDHAGNARTAASAPFDIVRDLIGYTPVTMSTVQTTRGALIELRFPEVLEGSTTRFDWEVSEGDADRTVLTTSQREEDGRTVIVLEITGMSDPNARPAVSYTERLGRLRGSDGLTPISSAPRLAVDGILPRLEVERPDAGPVNAPTAALSGQTDTTEFPNEVRVFRATADGGRESGTAARAGAGTDGAFALDVPLRRDAANDFVVGAVDPSGNVSRELAFRVVEDSTDPVVTITSPPADSQLGDTVPLRWNTVDAHPSAADIEVRIDGGGPRSIASHIADEGRFNWDVDDDIAEDAVLEFRVRAIDAAGNDGEGRRGGLLLGSVPGGAPGGGTPGDGAGPPTTGVDGITAVATSERTIDITFPAPVEVARGAAGFSVFQGPGVARVGGVGTTRTLVLNSDLSTTTPLVVYNGRGVSTVDGRGVEEFRIRAARGFAFAPEGLVGDSRDGTARLSWTDERNADGDVVRYEITRDGEPLDAVPGTSRSFTDSAAGDGVRTYTVTAVDDLDHVSRPASIRLDPNAPNITPAGGFVLSPDGKVALVVPPRAVRKDHYGRFETVSTGGTDGYQEITSGYRLVVEAADDRSERLTAFERFSCLSFRPGRSALDGHEPFRVMGLRLLTGDTHSELATRTGRDSAESCFLTTGDFALGEAGGVSTRIIGADPVIGDNRFATAVALSQSSFSSAGAAVIARADDYPDALAASAMAAQVGGPVLLSNTDELPLATVLELQRLGADRVILAGGTVALSDAVAHRAAELGFAVERVAGDNRFETAAAIAKRVGSFGGRAFLATGQQFPDALAGSAPSSMLTRPILLTGTDAVPQATLDALTDIDVTDLTILGGPVAVANAVESDLRERGYGTDRAAGQNRIETAVALADSLVSEGLLPVRPIAATGEGDGKTSPDALAAGPVAGRFASPLLLVPTSELGDTVANALRRAAGLRAVPIAGGVNAVSDRTRREIDAATR